MILNSFQLLCFSSGWKRSKSVFYHPCAGCCNVTVANLWLCEGQDIAATSENMIEKDKKGDTINSEREEKLAEETFWKGSSSKSSFVCLESLGFREAGSKQKKKKILHAVPRKSPTGIFWPMYTLKLLGLHLRVCLCRSLFPIYRWWNTSAVNHRLKFLKLLLSWGTNIASQNTNECSQFIDSVFVCSAPLLIWNSVSRGSLPLCMNCIWEDSSHARKILCPLSN